MFLVDIIITDKMSSELMHITIFNNKPEVAVS